MEAPRHPPQEPGRNTEPPAKRWTRWSLRALGPLALVAIVAHIEVEALLAALTRADPVLLVLGFVVGTPVVIPRALRWRVILGDAASTMPFRELLAAYSHSIFVGVATPGRVGEVVKTFQLTRRGVSFGTAFGSVLLDRLFDVGVLFAVAASGFLLLVDASGDGPWLGIAMLALCLAPFLAWRIWFSDGLQRVRQAALDAAPLRVHTWALTVGADFRRLVEAFSLSSATITLVLTLLPWSLTFGGTYLFAHALGFSMGYFELAAISAVCSIGAQLPISVLGAGTRDAILIVLLAGYGVSQPEAVALSTLMLSLTLWTGIACGLLWAGLRVGARAEAAVGG